MKKFLFIYCILLFLSGKAWTQNNVKVAEEYFNNGEFEKAYVEFEKISKDPSLLPVIYPHFLQTLKQLKKNSDAEKLIKKRIKAEPDPALFRADLYLFYKENGDTKKSEKEYNGIIKEYKNISGVVVTLSEYFVEKVDYDAALLLMETSRKSLNMPVLYSERIASIHYKKGNLEAHIAELLAFVEAAPDQKETVKNTFQNYLKEDKEFDALEIELYKKVQSSPENLEFNELLLWLNIQKKNFNKAFYQARAIDKKERRLGAKMIEVAKIAMENKAWEDAVRFYQFVIEEYPGGLYYAQARRELIRVKEESIKNSYPVQLEKIHSLLQDYNKLIQEIATHQAAYDAKRSMAMLYAFYLDKKDTAIVLLEDVIKNGRIDPRLMGKAKIDLGDIFLLKNEPWESTLLYSQVEKDFQEDPLGHEAKLRNAKLNYYKGDFPLAQEHLDVLKLATSREISNDAIELSILIQDNTGMDSTGDALRAYAAIDLLLFQNKLDTALRDCNQMLVKYADHGLCDEVWYLKHKLFLKMQRMDSALFCLDQIIKNYKEDILGDDAAYRKALYTEIYLKDNTNAMTYYRDFLVNYPASVYTADVRKRFRILRGDKLK